MSTARPLQIARQPSFATDAGVPAARRSLGAVRIKDAGRAHEQ